MGNCIKQTSPSLSYLLFSERFTWCDALQSAALRQHVSAHVPPHRRGDTQVRASLRHLHDMQTAAHHDMQTSGASKDLKISYFASSPKASLSLNLQVFLKKTKNKNNAHGTDTPTKLTLFTIFILAWAVRKTSTHAHKIINIHFHFRKPDRIGLKTSGSDGRSSLPRCSSVHLRHRTRSAGCIRRAILVCRGVSAS